MTRPAEANLLNLAPVPTLLDRLTHQTAAGFSADRAVRVSRAPGRLDVMGGIADYTGSLVLQATLDRAAAVALQDRDDRRVRVFSFNLFEEQSPSSFEISLDDLANTPLEKLSAEFRNPRQRWAGYLAGCLRILHQRGWVDLKSPAVRGFNLALYSTVPLGAGVSSSAAIEVATMMNLAAHFHLLDEKVQPLELAAMCQAVENTIVGAPCGIMDQVASCCGRADSLLRLLCQPHQLQVPLAFPAGVRAIGIDSRVKHSVGGGMYGKTRCAAFMGHRIILDKMRQMGAAAGKSLERDPLNGFLANLAPDDYKKFFRPYLPESISGQAFLEKHGGTIDAATKVNPAVDYHVQRATDHHVLESRRVKNFANSLQAAAIAPAGSPGRALLLNKAGHLMYASHISYTRDALLGADECDLLVQLVRQRKGAGLYGAKITGGGAGGTVAVLCDRGEAADAAIAQVMAEYHRRTGHEPQAFMGSSPGAWEVGTAVVANLSGANSN